MNFIRSNPGCFARVGSGGFLDGRIRFFSGQSDSDPVVSRRSDPVPDKSHPDPQPWFSRGPGGILTH